MNQLTIRYTALFFVIGIILVVLSSYVALGISNYTTSLLLREITRGLFLMAAFSLMFYMMGLQFYKANAKASNQYKRLFEENPNPMWVYDLENYTVLAVNQAALHTYGYSRDEFLKLSLMELRPEGEAEKLLDNLKMESPTYSSSGTWLHRRKDGGEFYVSIFSHSTLFNEKNARLVLALNINDRLIAEKRVLAQNEKLREIARLQSHDVRRPVASIMGLVHLFDKCDLQNEINGIVIEKLDVVCKELDTTIHKIVEKTYEMEVENQQ